MNENRTFFNTFQHNFIGKIVSLPLHLPPKLNQVFYTRLFGIVRVSLLEYDHEPI